jgi:hypothetical protein
MKFYLSLNLLVCISISTTANDLTYIVKNTIKGGNTGSIDLSITGGASPYQVKWTGPNGFNASTEDLTNLSVGTYTVLVTDAYCGTATTIITITDYLTSINEMNAEQINIFPNPAASEVQIELPAFFKAYHFRMMNALGEVVMERENERTSSFTIDMKNRNAGMYFIELLHDGQLYRKKIVKY